MNKGTLYVFTGPSGAGKGTLLSRLMAEDDRLFYSISATTRAPRSGETDGVQYYFLTRADFERKIAQNAFLEHARYVDNYYGTLEAPVNEKLAEGYDVILEIEVQGAMQVHQKRPDAVMVFIAPPSFEELAARLRGRGTEAVSYTHLADWRGCAERRAARHPRGRRRGRVRARGAGGRPLGARYVCCAASKRGIL